MTGNQELAVLAQDTEAVWFMPGTNRAAMSPADVNRWFRDLDKSIIAVVDVEIPIVTRDDHGAVVVKKVFYKEGDLIAGVRPGFGGLDLTRKLRERGVVGGSMSVHSEAGLPPSDGKNTRWDKGSEWELN
jgi:hypothetical protein